MDKTDLKTNIIAVLTSGGGRLPESKLRRDYRELFGNHIPYSKFGHRSLVSFLESLGGFYFTKDALGVETIIHAGHDEKTAHIASLVQRTRKKTNKPKKPKNRINQYKFAPRSYSTAQRQLRSCSSSNPFIIPQRHALSSNSPSTTQRRAFSSNPPSTSQRQSIFSSSSNPPIIPQRQALSSNAPSSSQRQIPSSSSSNPPIIPQRQALSSNAPSTSQRQIPSSSSSNPPIIPQRQALSSNTPSTTQRQIPSSSSSNPPIIPQRQALSSNTPSTTQRQIPSSSSSNPPIIPQRQALSSLSSNTPSTPERHAVSSISSCPPAIPQCQPLPSSSNAPLKQTQSSPSSTSSSCSKSQPLNSSKALMFLRRNSSKAKSSEVLKEESSLPVPMLPSEEGIKESNDTSDLSEIDPMASNRKKAAVVDLGEDNNKASQILFQAKTMPKAKSEAVKTHVEELASLAASLGLESPEYKDMEMHPKHGVPIYLAKVKLGGGLVYSSYPHEMLSPNEAQELAAYLACQDLRGKHNSLTNSAPVEDHNIEERVFSIVSNKRMGMFDEAIAHQYKEIYGVALPMDWISVIEKSPMMDVERYNKKAIVYPYPTHMRMNSASCQQVGNIAIHLSKMRLNNQFGYYA